MKVNKDPKIWLFVAVFAIVFVVMMLMPGMEQIPDNNGPADTSLATLTQADLVGKAEYTKGMRTSRGYLNLGSVTIDDGITFSSKEFSGVYDLCWSTFILPSTFYIDMYGFELESGNMMVYLLCDGEIVATFEPSIDNTTLRVDGLKGDVILRLACESASFKFTIPSHYEEQFVFLD